MMGESVLECPICLELFNDPVMLPCQHCFCWQCISICAKRPKAVCPLCNKPFNEDNISRNLILEQILENKNPSDPKKCKPSDESFPKTFDLGGSSRPQQQVQKQTEQNWGPTILAGAAGLLIGAVGVALGFTANSASKRARR
ncbi:unnamed protein product [Hymenolepis diminuta]|uniref:RING-type domain-containing protein n=1 Tax=Hymenolepis diminuta TaxID=6216 RepID=A0A564Y4S1_HYMDI|nr:unnamed protein product [Hymenolepis diminuta]